MSRYRGPQPLRNGVPGTAEWMRRKAARKVRFKLHHAAIGEIRHFNETAAVRQQADRAASLSAYPQLRKQPPRERNREGLVASQAPTVSVPALAGQKPVGRKNSSA